MNDEMKELMWAMAICLLNVFVANKQIVWNVTPSAHAQGVHHEGWGGVLNPPP